MILLDQGGRARSWSLVRPPSARLAPYVEFLWAQTLPESVAIESWRIVPDPSAHILFTRFAVNTSGDRPLNRASVVGPRSVFLDVSQRGRLYTMGLRLRPGALAALLPISAEETVDRSVRLKDVVPDAADDLETSITSAPTRREALRCFGSWAERLLRRGRVPDPRADALGQLVTANRGAHSVRAISRELGLSPRRLRSIARQEIGLSPKRLTRIVRSYAVLQSADHDSWSSAALAAGFHDESHMIHDFSALFGETPRRFLQRGDDRFLQV